MRTLAFALALLVTAAAPARADVLGVKFKPGIGEQTGVMTVRPQGTSSIYETHWNTFAVSSSLLVDGKEADDNGVALRTQSVLRVKHYTYHPADNTTVVTPGRLVYFKPRNLWIFDFNPAKSYTLRGKARWPR